MARIAIGYNEQKREGLLDSNGKWILEPTFQSIADFAEGYAVVEGAGHDPHGQEAKSEVGLIDRTGRWIVPFGKYTGIYSFRNGYAEVEYPSQDKEWGSESAYIDTTGKIVVYLPSKISKSIVPEDHYFSEGLLGLSLAKGKKLPTDVDDDYTCFIDSKGKMVINNQDYYGAYPFQEERSFAGRYYAWQLIDKKGEILIEELFYNIHHNGFEKGEALVETQSHKWGMIDRNGNYLIVPTYDRIHQLGFQGERLLVAGIDTVNGDQTTQAYQYEGKNFRWGMVDRQGNWLVKPIFSEVSSEGFRSGLLYVKQDSLYGYVNLTGKYVWKATTSSATNSSKPRLDTLNIDFMLRGYHYDYVAPRTPEQVPQSGVNRRNYSLALTYGMPFPANQLAVEVRSALADTFASQFVGMKVYVYNTTKDSAVFDVQDNRLYLKTQAVDRKGVWRDIEYLPSSWCGNSYYNIRLAPNRYWEFTIPVYSGDLPTQLRLALTIRRIWKDKEWKETTIYSNIFQGSVNPAQFWRQQGYSPQGLMDPYLN